MHEHMSFLVLINHIYIGIFQLLGIMQADKNLILNIVEGNVPFAVGKDTPIIAYCAAGVRAQSAVDMLVQEAQPAFCEFEEMLVLQQFDWHAWLVPEGYTDVMNGGGYSSQLEKVCQACAATTTSHFVWIWSIRFSGGKQKFVVARPFGTIFKSYRCGSFRNQLICCSSWCRKKTKKKNASPIASNWMWEPNKVGQRKKVIISISNQKSTGNCGYFTPIVELFHPAYNWFSGAHLVGTRCFCRFCDGLDPRWIVEPDV